MVKKYFGIVIADYAGQSIPVGIESQQQYNSTVKVGFVTIRRGFLFPVINHFQSTDGRLMSMGDLVKLAYQFSPEQKQEHSNP